MTCAQQIDLSVTPYYHCITRCVCRAFLSSDEQTTHTRTFDSFYSPFGSAKAVVSAALRLALLPIEDNQLRV